MQTVEWNVEPMTQLDFTRVVDLGEVQENAVRELARLGDMCIVTGCTEDARSDKSDQIRYDIIAVSDLHTYINQCQDRAGSEVFLMSAYPARDMQQARKKVSQLDSATVGGTRGYQANQLWNPPRRAA